MGQLNMACNNPTMALFSEMSVPRYQNDVALNNYFYMICFLAIAGREAEVYLYRDGSRVKVLARDNHFDPEMPKLHQ